MDLDFERSYPTPFANSPILPLLVLSLARQKNVPKTSTTFKKEYDYIIVGAGSAGSVLASRLSELPCVSVLLLEAGKGAPHLNDIPALARNFWFTNLDWAYKTVPQKHSGFGLNNGQVIFPSGKALGGSSVLNAMLYVRGNKKNYDDWEAQGAKKWSYKDVFPYFLKAENNQDPEYIANGYHGTSGPMTVERPRYNSDIRVPLFKAAKELGYNIVDSNANKQTGFYDQQATQRDGQRCSAAKAYLVPAENRTNLDILPNAFVKKVVIKRRRATGVEFEFQNRNHVVRARREVIMSAGTINSAQLLMLSGIGPKQHLLDMNIPVVADLPVGDNLQDHPTAIIPFELSPRIPTILEKFADPNTVQMYLQNRTGLLASTEAISALAFLNGLNVAPTVDFPDNQLYFVELPLELVKVQIGLKPEIFEKIFVPYDGKPFYVCAPSLIQPKSRGTVRLQSSNPFDFPLIDPNYYADKRDMDGIVKGLQACLRIGNSKTMRKLGSKPFGALLPGCEHLANNEERYLKCGARSVVLSLSHQVGTVKMGDPKDPSTVVDPELKVKGIQGLRVVDASIMPIVPSGNTNVPTLMVAEKASDIIKETINCRPDPPSIYKPETYEEYQKYKNIRPGTNGYQPERTRTKPLSSRYEY